MEFEHRSIAIPSLGPLHLCVQLSLLDTGHWPEEMGKMASVLLDPDLRLLSQTRPAHHKHLPQSCPAALHSDLGLVLESQGRPSAGAAPAPGVTSADALQTALGLLPAGGLHRVLSTTPNVFCN